MNETGGEMIKPGVLKTCAVQRLPRRLNLCGACRRAAKKAYQKRLTLDIALYFMVLHGYTVQKAAAELHVKPSALEDCLKKHRQSLFYNTLSAYYAGEKEKRNRIRRA